MELDDEDVRAILQLLDASAYDELQVETDRFSLTLRRAEGAWTRETRTLGLPHELAGAPPATGRSDPAAAVPTSAAAAASAGSAARVAENGQVVAGSTARIAENGQVVAAPAARIAENGQVVAAPAAPGAENERFIAVSSPLPGTFYRSPKPGAPPFVEVGTHVERDTVVAIVETMKLMNSVYAGTAGRVAEICLADAQFAAQGVVLMRIEPDLS